MRLRGHSRENLLSALKEKRKWRYSCKTVLLLLQLVERDIIEDDEEVGHRSSVYNFYRTSNVHCIANRSTSWINSYWPCSCWVYWLVVSVLSLWIPSKTVAPLLYEQLPSTLTRSDGLEHPSGFVVLQSKRRNLWDAITIDGSSKSMVIFQLLFILEQYLVQDLWDDGRHPQRFVG